MGPVRKKNGPSDLLLTAYSAQWLVNDYRCIILKRPCSWSIRHPLDCLRIRTSILPPAMMNSASNWDDGPLYESLTDFYRFCPQGQRTEQLVLSIRREHVEPNRKIVGYGHTLEAIVRILSLHVKRILHYGSWRRLVAVRRVAHVED